MTDTTKIEKWAYPFKTAGDSSAEVSDPQLYYDALAKANSGFYPMGINGLWHGGVHFDAGTGAALDQSAVRCIADGEVIAYRIDERYPTSQYGEGPTAVHLPFSTGFVLVKHRLELPALPTAPTPASTAPTVTPATTTPTAATPTATPSTPAPAPVTSAPTAPAAEALTFYSLYMHLLDWTRYCTPGAPTPAEFLAPSLYTVSTRPTDPQLGLRVRLDGPGSDILALLPKGCKVTLGESYPHKTHWRQLLSVDEGAAIPPLASGVIGWVYEPQLTGNTVADLAKDDEPALTLSHQGLNVRQEGKLHGTIIAVLPRGAQLKVGPKETGGYCKVLEVLDYKGVPALLNGPDGKLLGYVYHADLDASRTPPTFDTVTPLPTPIRIKAGELIGHLGQYQNHNDATPKALLHLEVFSCDDVLAFISKSQARAASLPNSAKTLLKIHKGASKLIPHREGISASNPPKINDEGVTVGVNLIIPQSLLDTLPSSSKILVPAKNDTWACSSEIRWWRLENLLADDAGNPISGWLAEQDMITTRHSPWEWEGFDFISETTSSTEQLANHLAGQCLLSEAELPDYQAQISTADNGPIKTRLYDIIDGADGTVRDEKLTVKEIKAALGKPWHAQSISQLISHYESEWYWQDAKWDELDKLMEHTPATPNTNWVAEKARIKTLAWWDKVEGQHGIKAGGMAWHIHVAGLIGSLISKNNADTGTPTGKVTYEAEGNDVSSSPYFSRVIHWPGNDLSGVTLGRGYDMGFRSESEIYTHMSTAGISHEKSTQISQAHGLRGQAAQQFVTTNKTAIGEITNEQQVKLFNDIYPEYIEKAINNYNHWTNTEQSRSEWGVLHLAIKDILVDFVYQGFTKGPNPMKAGMTNNIDTLINYIESTPTINQYENGRHRANYLRSNR